MKYVLSVAGYDPSAGAGVLADVKTFENLNVHGLAAITAVTYQSDNSFLGLDWFNFEQIKKQIDPILKFNIEAVKIGIIKDFETLKLVSDYLRSQFPDVFIVWDPVIRASAGFEFHSSSTNFAEVCNNIDLITPNFSEAKFLSGELEVDKITTKLASICRTLIKGIDQDGFYDLLVGKGANLKFEKSLVNNLEKHGSGCVFSSVITAEIAKGHSLDEACYLAQNYVDRFRKSDPGLLGVHKGVIA